jgi:ABC-type glycerol-3-phosphate transport system substrate-binding protein
MDEEVDLNLDQSAERRFARRELLRAAGAAALALPLVDVRRAVAASQGARDAKTITLTFPNNFETANTAQGQVLTNLVRTFHQKYPNASIDLINVDESTMNTKNRTDCAAGHCNDIILEWDYLYATSGWSLNLSPWVNQAWRRRFTPASLAPNIVNGHVYALPVSATPLVWFWNEALIKSIGGKIPTTIPELLKLGELAKKNNLFLMSNQLGTNQMVQDWLIGYPGGMTALARGHWDHPSVHWAAKTLKTIIENGYTPPNDLSMDYHGAYALFQQKKILTGVDGDWTILNNLTPGGKDVYGLASGLAFTSSVPPDVPKGKRASMVYSNGVALASDLKKDPAKLHAGINFLNLWTTPRQAELWLASQAPTGVRVPIPNKYPLLKKFVAAGYSAQIVYTGAIGNGKTAFLRTNLGGATYTMATALAAGKSVDEAVNLYVKTQEKLQKQAG